MTLANQNEEWLFKSRVYVGQVDTVDEVNGTVAVRIGGTHDKLTAVIPMGGLSLNGAFSSWMRYMPSPGDYVQIAYGPRNEPEVVGYTSWGTSASDDSVSYTGNLPQRVRAEGYAAIAGLARSDTSGLRIFRQLRSGEFDARSAGGAGWWATREGTLLLEAGETTVTLNKAEEETRVRSDLTVVGGDGVEWRLGDVKRKTLPTDFEESTVLANVSSAAAPKELRVRVGYDVPVTGLELTYASWAAGDVRDGLGVPVLNTNTGAPDRFRAQMFDPSGLLAVTTVEVDILGNTRVAPTTFTVATDLPASIKLGSFFALEPYVKGLTWTTARAIQHTAQIAALGTQAALETANAVLYATQGAAATVLSGILLAGPPKSPQSVEALNALLGQFFAAFGIFLTTQTPAYYVPSAAAFTAQATAIGAFEAGSPSYLSIKILGE